MQLTPQQIAQYREQGYVTAKGVYTAQEVAKLREHFMAVRATGSKPGDYGAEPDKPNDPLNKFPRMINMHDWDEETKTAAGDARLLAGVAQLTNDVAVLNQTMLYFKPPLARGQALHQDQQYITIDPLVGVWVALDDSDSANGQMVVVPGSNKLGLLPVEAADLSTSFTGGQSRLPSGAKIVGVDMKAGDVLFFDGKTIHGSYPNTTTDRFRRSFICHYITKGAKKFEPAKGTHMSHLHAK
ncbi:MAG: phytanoyl-CoA dioxygenase family protein [Planctomycetota bacterium]|nr:phytanoyl-CoA dioxygenase family protein [Planctomycetota bacterium]